MLFRSYLTAANNRIDNFETIIPEKDCYNTKAVIIEGMMCEHCVARVKSALENISDKPVTVSLSENIATVDERLDDKLIKDTIKKAGYKVTDIK